jgi:hypothetical protein
MRRGIIAVGLASLLSFATPVYAADLTMPVKAPPPAAAPPPPVFEWWPALLLIPFAAAAVCLAVCQDNDRPGPVSAGGPFPGPI